MFFGFHPLSFSAPLAFVALLILLWIIFKVNPLNQRFTFVLSLAIGSSMG